MCSSRHTLTEKIFRNNDAADPSDGQVPDLPALDPRLFALTPCDAVIF
jgi:hypothetical protein